MVDVILTADFICREYSNETIVMINLLMDWRKFFQFNKNSIHNDKIDWYKEKIISRNFKDNVKSAD